MNQFGSRSSKGAPTGSNSLMNDMTQFLMSHGGPVLFAIVFAEQAGLPLPSAPWLLAAGALSASGKLSPALAIGATALAAVMADSIWFYVGRKGGQRVLRLFCRLSLSRNSCVGRTKGLFARQGLQALVAAKFLPGLGAVMPPLAGALGMSTRRFLLFDGLGSLVYASAYITAGFLFHEQLSQALAVLNQLGLSALLLASALVAGYIAFKFARRGKFISAGLRRNHTVNQPVGEGVGDAKVTTGGAYPNIVVSPVESLNALELQNVALAATGSPSPSVVVHAPAPLVPGSV
jgi:membrane protein DedA with SNARE-associated domain